MTNDKLNLSTEEITIVLIKHFKLHEGKYALKISYGSGFGSTSDPEGTDEIYPSWVIAMRHFGLNKITEDAQSFGLPVIDASIVNPKKTRTKK